MIVDTAGLSDSNGCLYDIANSIGLEMAFHNAKTAKILFLIKESSIFDERGNILRKLI